PRRLSCILLRVYPHALPRNSVLLWYSSPFIWRMFSLSLSLLCLSLLFVFVAFNVFFFFLFFFSSRRRHTRFSRDWSSDVCSSDLVRLRERSARHRSRRCARRAGAGARPRRRSRASRHHAGQHLPARLLPRRTAHERKQLPRRKHPALHELQPHHHSVGSSASCLGNLQTRWLRQRRCFAARVQVPGLLEEGAEEGFAEVALGGKVA